MCEDCKAAEQAQRDNPFPGTHRASCLVWALPHPKPEDCDCRDEEREEAS